MARLAIIATTLIGVGLAFQDLFSGDQVPFYRDLLFFVIPFKHFLGEALRRGEIPLWNPWLHMGVPFLAGLQTGVLYPPSLLLALPFPLGFNVFLLFHYLLALIGSFVFLVSPRLPIAAAAIGASSFVLGGYLVSMMNLTSHLQTAAWAPWVMYSWDRVLVTRRPPAVAGFIASLALLILGGAPELLVMVLALLAGWTIYRSGTVWIEASSHISVLAGGVATALGLVAFQILPTLEYMAQSQRGTALPLEEVVHWSLEPVSLLRLLLPLPALAPLGDSVTRSVWFLEPLYPWISTIYLGLATLVFAIGGLFVGQNRRFWALLLFVAIVLALGEHTPIFGWLYHAFPSVFGKFRYPEKFFFLAQLSVMVLASQGSAAILRGDRRIHRLVIAAAATFACVGASILVLHWAAPDVFLDAVIVATGNVQRPTQVVELALEITYKAQRLLLIVGTLIALLILRDRNVVSSSVLAVLLPALVVVDLASINHRVNGVVSWSELSRGRPLSEIPAAQAEHTRVFHYQTVSHTHPRQPTTTVLGLEQWRRRFSPSLHFFGWQGGYANIPMMVGLGTLGGMDGISRTADLDLRNILSIVTKQQAIKILGLYSVGYLVGPVALDAANLVPVPTNQDSTYMYGIANPLPYAYLVDRPLVATGTADAYNAIISSGFEPGVHAIVTQTPRVAFSPESSGPVGQVLEVDRSAELVRIRVEGNRPALLVLNDAFYPGWIASLDGQPTDIIRTNVMVRGVVVDRGIHEIEFRYEPRSFSIGLWISGLTLGLCIVGFTAFSLRRSVFRAFRLPQANPEGVSPA